jgi:ParB-like chromosome segregation protein Spo0J
VTGSIQQCRDEQLRCVEYLSGQGKDRRGAIAGLEDWFAEEILSERLAPKLDLIGQSIVERARELFAEIRAQALDGQIETINALKLELHSVSPFVNEPVDCVLWVKSEDVQANDYNPNSVAPPEMKLLERSIDADGYTQPIVAWPRGDIFEVVDGFHRNRVGKESKVVRERVRGHLPVTIIRHSQTEKGDRIASTIRHNRARGKHKVESMSDIVIELKRRNWTDERISRDLGMDQDEILRLCQITGLAEMFSDKQFSASWDVEGQVSESDFTELSDDVTTYGEEADSFRTVNTSDESRIFHTYDKWECYKAGFYNPTLNGLTPEECARMYQSFLTNDEVFSAALEHVTTNWKHSCEHYLTNTAMNRIAWLGQAAACHAMGIPSTFRGGFNLLNETEAQRANELALKYLNRWLTANGRPEVTMAEGYSGDRQSDIY